MCGPSFEADVTIEALEGESYTVKTNKWGMGALTPPDKNANECVACVRGDQTKLTLQNIPLETQQQYGIDSTEEVIFVEASLKSHIQVVHDHARLRDGRLVPFWKFEGSTAHVGVLSDEEAVKDDELMLVVVASSFGNEQYWVPRSST